ncbi:Mitochondrial distribution/morphology family 35/apoptosis [Elaphomyces granulatus]
MSASLALACNSLKEKYDTCFLRWYSEKYLRGNTRDECAELFSEYKKCLTKALKDRGIDTMLDEARKNSRESDTEHLKKP